MRPFDFVKQSICHRLFSPTFKGKRSLHFRGFDHIFLETKKIEISAAFEVMPKCSQAGTEHGPLLTSRAERTCTGEKGRVT